MVAPRHVARVESHHVVGEPRGRPRVSTLGPCPGWRRFAAPRTPPPLWSSARGRCSSVSTSASEPTGPARSPRFRVPPVAAPPDATRVIGGHGAALAAGCRSGRGPRHAPAGISDPRPATAKRRLLHPTVPPAVVLPAGRHQPGHLPACPRRRWRRESRAVQADHERFVGPRPASRRCGSSW
jgi:hypothetical protein